MKEDSKVFVIGLPRSGTTSLDQALQTLGYNTLHNPRHLKEEQFRGVYRFSDDSWDAITNFGEHIYPQLDKTYPNSKFILTIRDKEKWLDSIGWKQAEACVSEFGKRARIELFGTYVFNKERYSYVYDLHYKNVLNYFKDRPNDLLVMFMDEGDGWEKLCPFLGKEIPDESFPHVHTRQQVIEDRKQREKQKTFIQKMRNKIITLFK